MVEVKEISKTTDTKIDELEAALLNNCPLIDCPLVHTFVPGMYIRRIFMPKGKYNPETGVDDINVVTSMIHKTTHPFFVLSGKVAVFSENDGEQIITAPFHGFTTPGTRRVLRIIESCVWVTCHVTSIQPKDDSDEAILEAADRVLDEIIDMRVNPLIGSVVRQNKIQDKNIVNSLNLPLCQ